MSALPWYKRDVDAWRGGTRGMSLELRGFYSELLDALWDRQKPLENDETKLAVMVGCNKRTVRKLLPQLIALGKLKETPVGLINERMSRDIFDANSRPVRSEFASNSSGIQVEQTRKNPKNPMNSTRALELEEELRTKRNFDLFKKQEEARAYEATLEQVDTGGLRQ